MGNGMFTLVILKAKRYGGATMKGECMKGEKDKAIKNMKRGKNPGPY